MSEEPNARERLATVEEKLDQLAHAVDERFTSVDERFTSVDERFNAVDERFNAVDERFNAVDERFNAIDAAFVEQRQYTEFAFEQQTTAMSEIRTEVRAGFADVSTRFDRFERKLDQFIDAQSRTNALVERRLTALEPPSTGETR